MSDPQRAARKASIGWFETPGRPGDRTLESQLIGLAPLFDGIAGKTVLDVGCAEGLIAMECCRRGASSALGVEMVAAHVEVGRSMLDGSCELVVGDANICRPDRNYDVVLLLAILHKLRNPSAACKRYAKACSDLCVIRFPASSLHRQVIVDHRSGGEPYDIGGVMRRQGFRVMEITDGPKSGPDLPIEKTYFYVR